MAAVLWELEIYYNNTNKNKGKYWIEGYGENKFEDMYNKIYFQLTFPLFICTTAMQMYAWMEVYMQMPLFPLIAKWSQQFHSDHDAY